MPETPADETGGLHVLRFCSVFEPEAGSIEERAVRFDPIGGMQNHTAALSRCLDEQGLTQTVLTARLAAGCGTSTLGRRGTVRRVGLRTSRLRQLWGLAALPHVVRAQGVDLVPIRARTWPPCCLRSWPVPSTPAPWSSPCTAASSTQ
jgi:glycogen(starch) synthase